MPAQTTLAAAITTTNATTATVRDVLGFASSSEASDLVQVDAELLLVSGGLGTTSWSSITRGYAGTTAATHLSGATVTRVARGWTDLVTVKRALDIADTDDDAYLLDLIDEVNDELTGRVGVYLGPATDTVRAYDGHDATHDGTRLHVPGGIRTLTQVRIADETGGAWTIATLADFLLRPASHELRSGEPARWVQVSDAPAGSVRAFPAGYANVELTGTFGWSEPPARARAIATQVVSRMMADRRAGSLAVPSPSKFLFPDDVRTLERLASIEHPRIR